MTERHPEETAGDQAADRQRQDQTETGAGPAGFGSPDDSGADTLQQDLAAAQNQLLRMQADLDNYRKRVQREQELERRYAAMPLLRDLLPVVDNIQRAIDAAEKAGEAASLLDGFKMVAQQLESVFAQHHCQPIPAAGEAFDPNLHEAISQIPSEEHPRGTVLQVAQTGYRLHDRVVRPSQVIVSAGPPEETT